MAQGGKVKSYYLIIWNTKVRPREPITWVEGYSNAQPNSIDRKIKELVGVPVEVIQKVTRVGLVFWKWWRVESSILKISRTYWQVLYGERRVLEKRIWKTRVRH